MAYPTYRKRYGNAPAYVKPAAAVRVPFVFHGMPSAQQTAICATSRGTTHRIFNARAGTGKTTTSMLDIKSGYVPGQRVGICTFSKKLGDELQSKVPAGVDAGTTHSMLGCAALRMAGIKYRVDTRSGYKSMAFLPDAMDYAVKQTIAKVVSLCKAMLLDGTDREALLDLMADYDIDPGKHLADVLSAVPDVLRKSREMTSVIDFDDMLWLPVVLNLPVPQYDRLYVDESQDLNPCQIELIFRAILNGLLTVVGDEFQSIFGFRGADPEAMQHLHARLAASAAGVISLPLTISQRCSRLVTAMARGIVSDFECRPDAPDGTVCLGSTILQLEPTADDSYAYTSVAHPDGFCTAMPMPGQMLICRTNAPLIEWAYRLIGTRTEQYPNGIPVKIQGRDIGAGLKVKILRLAKETDDTATLMAAAEDFRDSETAKLVAAGKGGRNSVKLQALTDSVDCIIALCEGIATVAGVLARVESLFSDVAKGDASGFVWLSSVHRAKGLESDTVFVIRPELMPHPMARNDKALAQEANLQYVAITRAKSVLHYH